MRAPWGEWDKGQVAVSFQPAVFGPGGCPPPPGKGVVKTGPVEEGEGEETPAEGDATTTPPTSPPANQEAPRPGARETKMYRWEKVIIVCVFSNR